MIYGNRGNTEYYDTNFDSTIQLSTNIGAELREHII